MLLLLAMCGNTPPEKGEVGIAAGAVAWMIGAATRVRALSLVGAAATSLGFAAYSWGRYQELKKKQAAGTLGVDEKRLLIYEALLTAGSAPALAIALPRGAAAIAMRGGWRFFIPFRWSPRVNAYTAITAAVSVMAEVIAHKKVGENPLLSRHFYLNLTEYALSTLIGGHALVAATTVPRRLAAAGLMSLTYTSTNVIFQSFMSLAGKGKQDARNHQFANMWAWAHSNPRNFIEWPIFHGLKKRIEAGTLHPSMFYVLLAAKLADAYHRRVWYSHAKANYLFTDKGFWKSYLSIRWRDFLPWIKKGDDQKRGSVVPPPPNKD